MPRPKVHDSIRQRAVQACAPCKISKRRCDCKQPCSNCIKRDDTASCVFKSHLPRIAGRSKARQSISTTDLEVDTNDQPVSSCPSPAGSRQVRERARLVRDGPRTAPNMLWTSRGVHVHVGSSASLSFLILLRDSLTRFTGRTAFTDASHSSIMLESRAPDLGGDPCCSYNVSDHTELVDVYYAATCGILDLLPGRDEVISTYLGPDLPINQSAVLHAMLALGAQCRGNGIEDRQCELYHLRQARELAFGALQDDQLDVDIVRVFTIMSFYMLGACRRNIAFMFLGIAARASDALGLYLQAPRYALWKSVRILDLLVAAVLGRSPGTCVYGEGFVRDGAKQDMQHRQLCLEASFEVWSLVDQVVQELYRRGKSDNGIIRNLLNRLSRWSADLHMSVKSSPQSGMPLIQQKECIIGNLHVSCAYYYAVIITTRKPLITVLHKKLLGLAESGVVQKSESTETIDLAQACIDSAILLLQTCREVQDAGMLLENMCLLKAWIFAAGLIAGFAFFVDPEGTPGLEQALLDAVGTLQHMSIASIQAEQYHDIIQALHNAAGEHHQRLACKSAQTQAPLVTKLFSMGQSSGPTIAPFDGWSQSGSTLLPTSLPGDDVFSTESIFTPGGFGIGDMESIAAQFWDELLLDRERLAVG